MNPSPQKNVRFLIINKLAPMLINLELITVLILEYLFIKRFIFYLTLSKIQRYNQNWLIHVKIENNLT